MGLNEDGLSLSRWGRAFQHRDSCSGNSLVAVRASPRLAGLHCCAVGLPVWSSLHSSFRLSWARGHATRPRLLASGWGLRGREAAPPVVSVTEGHCSAQRGLLHAVSFQCPRPRAPAPRSRVGTAPLLWPPGLLSRRFPFALLPVPYYKAS